MQFGLQMVCLCIFIIVVLLLLLKVHDLNTSSTSILNLNNLSGTKGTAYCKAVLTDFIILNKPLLPILCPPPLLTLVYECIGPCVLM